MLCLTTILGVYFHSRAPWFHSWYSPKIRMAIKKEKTLPSRMGCARDMVTGTGRIRVISTSKIRKITAIKKKRRENGKRLGLLGSNPHSNGDGFSRS